MAVSFRVETWIAAPPAEVFDAARDVDLHVGSQAGAGERAVGGVTTGLIESGQKVTWRATHFGVPFSMTSRVTELDRPHRFVDEQVRGPFRSFWHEHVFTPTGAGTTMVDTIRFRAPLGPIGSLVERALLGRYLEGLIVERGAFLRAALQG